jgi:hypothetical protein
MKAQLDLDEDIFARPPRRAGPPTSRIHCRVCDLVTTIPIDAPALLCVHCRSDLDATAKHIADRLAAAESHAAECYERLSADVAHADVETQERYGRVIGALANVESGAMSRATFDARLRATLAQYSELGRLMERFDAWNDAAESAGRVREWAGKAMREVEAAR